MESELDPNPPTAKASFPVIIPYHFYSLAMLSHVLIFLA
ncbi:hypothetical protein COLO4_20261 [Corchorus olitorius]|uniref:Uncharacterized protein n=1 Tax=Corchorus olitorius TaxID=93759 RepID=A0A1R3J0S2_9ROSI|nr:hypothetical protein COLO4_20261 [Corchorus olitorius]